jgi:DNA primase
MKLTVAELNAMLSNGANVYQHYYPLVTGRPLGHLNTKMLSPFRDEDDPSFQFFPHYSSGIIYFKDQGIEKKGDHWKFVMELFGIDFPTALPKVKADIRKHRIY